MIEQPIRQMMRWYFLLYFGIAAGQFFMFSFMQGIGLLYFLWALMWIAGWVLIAGRLPERGAWWIIGLGGLLLKGLWIVFVQTPAVSDYSLMYHAAREIMEGKREYLTNIYYERFPYQLGFTSYQALVLSIIDSVTGLKWVNAGWCALASLAVYGIARETVSRRAAILAMLLHATLLPILVMSSVLTNQHIAVAWLYGGIYVWIKAGRTWQGAIAAGALLAVGNIMRPIGIIVIAAIVVNEALHWLRQPAGKAAAFGLARAGACIASYAVILALAGMILSQTGISPEGLRNNDPLWKFVAGLNAAANGSYSTGDERLLNYGYMDPEKRTALEKEIIKERLTDVRNLMTLPFVKIGKLWADYQPYWFTFPKMEGTKFNYLGWPVAYDEVIDRYRKWERAVFYVLALAAFLGILRYMRTRQHHHGLNLLVLILGAYTFVHLWVEVQPRYMYFLFGILMVFAAPELIRLEDRVRGWWCRRGG